MGEKILRYPKCEREKGFDPALNPCARFTFSILTARFILPLERVIRYDVFELSVIRR